MAQPVEEETALASTEELEIETRLQETVTVLVLSGSVSVNTYAKLDAALAAF